MSPEYAWTGTFSEKSDIYSFGVLMLEIITGKEISSFSYGKDNKNLLSYVRTYLNHLQGLNLILNSYVFARFLFVVTGMGLVERKRGSESTGPRS